MISEKAPNFKLFWIGNEDLDLKWLGIISDIFPEKFTEIPQLAQEIKIFFFNINYFHQFWRFF